MTTPFSVQRYDIGVKGQGQTYLISVLRLVTQIPLSYFCRGCSYFDVIRNSGPRVEFPCSTPIHMKDALDPLCLRCIQSFPSMNTYDKRILQYACFALLSIWES